MPGTISRSTDYPNCSLRSGSVPGDFVRGSYWFESECGAVFAGGNLSPKPLCAAVRQLPPMEFAEGQETQPQLTRWLALQPSTWRSPASTKFGRWEQTVHHHLGLRR